ncbi:hypothetical protein GLOIN_2v1773502 [Rhizophagus irregularis DAOM 181602=DAOM 197198]|nr:hypothetical protein GLOIN_2v1773502 [Rhizophagus irregularis DAOM 181602=DAOM 197198]
MFHPDFNYITDKLPVSIKDRAYQRLLNHSHKPIPLNQISEKNKRIEDYLLHTLEIYQKSLDRNRKTMDRKKLRPQSWPECPAPLTLPISYVTDNGTQTETFGRFMQNLSREYEERIKANSQLRYEIIEIKAQVQGIEKALAFMKSSENN